VVRLGLEQLIPMAPIEISIPKEVRKLLRFGSGVGIEVGPKDLEVMAARVRPGRVRVLGRLTIRDFAGRPAAEWGSEYAKFLQSLGASHLSATVLLPRREVIVRQVALAGVSARDMESAIRFQLDSLHPYGEDETAWGWSPLGRGVALVGIALRSTVDRYARLFTEAGIAVASFTFSAAVLHAAIGLHGAMSGEGFVALGRAASGAVETYGESPARPVFSAEFDMSKERAAALAVAELRLAPGAVPLKLEDALPAPDPNPPENDLSRNALPFATALAGACPWLAPAANVLPPEHRRYRSRAMFAPTVALAVLLLVVLGGAAAWSRVAEQRYLDRLRAEIARLQPRQQRGLTLDRDAERARARAQWLDEYRGQTRRDLDVLNALTNLVEPPAWTNSLDITRDSVRLQGEARQAASLWKIIDGSGIFKSSTLDYSQPNAAAGESFVIRATREAGK
jgi:Tfp pilus assembly protein PilN